MPIIKNKKLYNAVYNFLTNEYFADTIQEKLNELKDTELTGTAVYRYVNYYNGPQDEASTRALWKPLAEDKTNRWTGTSATCALIGSQGLYLSLDNPGECDTYFAELEHYIREDTTDHQKVTYTCYQTNKPPVTAFTNGSNLRTLFLFSLKRSLQGINLKLSNPKAVDFLRWVLSQAQNTTLEKITQEEMEKLYNNPIDASFCRAIGNGLFALPTNKHTDFLRVTSARTRKAEPNSTSEFIEKFESVNMILRVTYVAPKKTFPDTGDLLEAQGRITWFLDTGNEETREILKPVAKIVVKAVYTDDDLKYNGTIPEENLAPIAKQQ